MSLPTVPGRRDPVESKVKWSTVGAYLGSATMLFLTEAITAEPVLVTPLPDWIEPFALAWLPTIAAFAAGWKARHTPRRPDPTSPPRMYGTP